MTSGWERTFRSLFSSFSDTGYDQRLLRPPAIFHQVTVGAQRWNTPGTELTRENRGRDGEALRQPPSYQQWPTGHAPCRGHRTRIRLTQRPSRREHGAGETTKRDGPRSGGGAGQNRSPRPGTTGLEACPAARCSSALQPRRASARGEPPPAGPLTCPAPSRRSASRTASCPRRSPWRPSPHPLPAARLAAPTRSLRLHSPPLPSTRTGLSAAILGPGNNPTPYSPPKAAPRFQPTRSDSAAGWVRLGQSQRGSVARRVGKDLGAECAAVAARSAPPVMAAALRGRVQPRRLGQVVVGVGREVARKQLVAAVPDGPAPGALAGLCSRV